MYRKTLLAFSVICMFTSISQTYGQDSCSAPSCPALTISGHDKVSYGEVAYYTLNAGAPKNITWSVDNPRASISGSYFGAFLTVNNACDCNNGTITITAKDTETGCYDTFRVQAGTWVPKVLCGRGLYECGACGGPFCSAAAEQGLGWWEPIIRGKFAYTYTRYSGPEWIGQAACQADYGAYGGPSCSAGNLISVAAVSEWQCPTTSSQTCSTPCSLGIAYFKTSASTFDPYSEIICLSGLIDEATNKSVGWTIEVKDNKGKVVKSFSGGGAYVGATWDGKDNDGNIVTGGVYTAKLTARTDSGQCINSKEITITIGSCNDIWYKDADSDGYTDGTSITQCTRPSGYKSLSELKSSSILDCDDGNAAINANTIWYKDIDDDKYTDGVTATQCERPTGYKLLGELLSKKLKDCNDYDDGDIPVDTDKDGIPDCKDTDDDNDGCLDEVDAYPLDKYKGCCPEISELKGSNTTISPSAGGTINFKGTVTSPSNNPISWRLDVPENTFSGSGKTIDVTWNTKTPDRVLREMMYVCVGPGCKPLKSQLKGYKPKYKYVPGKVIAPGTYKATLSVTQNNCPVSSKTITFTVTKNDDCNLKVNFGSSANIAGGSLHQSQDLFTVGNQSFTLSYNSTDGYLGPLGTGWTHNYDIFIFEQEDGSVVLFNGDRGRKLYTLSENGYTPEPGEYSKLIKNADGTFTITYKEGSKYNFDEDGWISSIVDRNNNATTFTYNADGNFTTITDPTGRTATLSYNTDYRIATINDPNGNTHSFTYSGDDLVNTVTQSPVGSPQSWSYTYYENSFMKTKTDPNGYTTAYTYDEDHRVVTSTDPEGKVKAITYPSNTDTDTNTVKTTTVTEKDGGNWTYSYDTQAGTLTQKTDPENGTTSYTYDANRNMTSKTEADGSVTSYTYDASGNMASTTDALNQTTTYVYNSYGQATSITASDGTNTSYEYDANGNLTKTTDSTGATTSYRYDSKGNVTSIANAAGQTTTFSYDQSGNLTSIKDSSGATTTFTYDAAGNMTSQTDASGNTTRFEYNSLGRLIKVIDPNGNSTTNIYDNNGNKTSSTDANGNITYYEYNYKGQLTKVKDALGNITTYSYGGTGCSSCGGGVDKLTAITDSNGNSTKYEYDTLGRLTKEADPLGNAISYSYDSKGNLISKTDANGATTSYSYDSLGRLLKKTYPDTTAESFTYDAKGNVLTATNSNISYSLSYNTNGKATSVTDSSGRTVSYSYDSLGNKTKLTYPEGSSVTYSYDTANRLTSVVNGNGKTYTYSYDNSGRRTKLSLPNGTSASYSYDTAGRLTSLTHKTSSNSSIASFAYTHDNVGNRLTKALDTGTKYTYSYDSIYRLTEALSSTPGYSSNTTSKGNGVTTATQQQKEFYTYDPVGNKLSSDKYSTYTYNQGNQLLTNGGTYSYDKNGNLTSKIEGTTAFSYYYDYENRLVKVGKVENGTTTTAEYRYDPFGRRIEKKVTEGGTATTTRFVYDNEDIILEYDGSGNTGNRYVHGPGIDEPLAVINGKNTYYYHADGLGSIVALTDSAGKTQQTYEYDSFGNLKDQKNKVKQPYTYTGREWDKEAGLYYLRARFYDPKVGRFISKDPLGFKGGDINLYAAFRDNPINNTDPSGMAVYRCTRPLNFSNSSLLMRYLGIGHRYLWVDSMGGGYGLAPQAGYAALSLTMLTVPGFIEKESTKIGCTMITNDQCKEQKVKELIELAVPQQYNLISYNCYDWASTIEKLSGL